MFIFTFKDALNQDGNISLVFHILSKTNFQQNNNKREAIETQIW